jgi:hypothetical protein
LQPVVVITVTVPTDSIRAIARTLLRVMGLLHGVDKSCLWVVVPNDTVDP